MKTFDYYLKRNDVRTVTKDPALASSLAEDARKRAELILKLPLTAESAKLLFEQVYESLREYADALLALEGYKSYSHMASIAYLGKFEEFEQSEIEKLDQAREKRNLAKYYAKPIIVEETADIIRFFKKIEPKFERFFA